MLKRKKRNDRAINKHEPVFRRNLDGHCIADLGEVGPKLEDSAANPEEIH